MRKVIVLLALLAFAAVIPASAQTTTYNVSAVSGGTQTYPFRAFNIPLDQGASIPWLEIGNGVNGSFSCGITTSAPTTLGFIFLSGTVANDGYVPDPNNPNPCFNLTFESGNYVEFAGVTGSGTNFTGTFSFVKETFRCGYGRFVHTCFRITSGTLTITE